MTENDPTPFEDGYSVGKRSVWSHLLREATAELGYSDTALAIEELAETRAAIYALARDLGIEINESLHLADMVRRIRHIIDTM